MRSVLNFSWHDVACGSHQINSFSVRWKKQITEEYVQYYANCTDICVCMRIYPHIHTHLYMNRIHLEPCCLTARSVMMEMPSSLSNTEAASHRGPLNT